MKKILLSAISSMVLVGSLCAAENTSGGMIINGHEYRIAPEVEKVLFSETFVIAKDANLKPIVLDKVLITTIPGSGGQCKIQIDSTRYEYGEIKENGFSRLIAKDNVQNTVQRSFSFLCPAVAGSTTQGSLFRYRSNNDESIDLFTEQSVSSSSTTIQRNVFLRYFKSVFFSLEQKDEKSHPEGFSQTFDIQTSFKN